MSGSLSRWSTSVALTSALALLAASATSVSQLPAQSAPAGAGGRVERVGHVAASLIAPQEATAPASVLRLGVRLVLDPGWHVYAAARNDSGLPVLVRPELPAGWEAGPLLWPVPQRHLSPGPLLDHVYEDEVLLMFDVRVPADAQPGDSVTLRAHLEWLVCDQACVVGGADVELPMSISAAGNPPAPGPSAALFAAAATRLPEAWPTTSDATAPIRAERLAGAVQLVAPGAIAITLLPAEDCVELPLLVEEGTSEGDTLLLRLVPNGAQDGARDLQPGDRLKGWVSVGYPGDTPSGPARARSFALDLPLTDTPAPPDVAPPLPRFDPVPIPDSGEPR